MSQILDNVLPVFVLMALGRLVMARGWAPASFFTISDKLTYFIFFPALLFLKIGSAGAELSAPRPSFPRCWPRWPWSGS